MKIPERRQWNTEMLYIVLYLNVISLLETDFIFCFLLGQKDIQKIRGRRMFYACLTCNNFRC